MIEVECRTCLEMSDLKNSFSIQKKFFLGKSFKEVILLFAPEMITVIWSDDIICFTCSKVLYAFAQFIERIIAVEKRLKNSNKGRWKARPILELKDHRIQPVINIDVEYSHEQPTSSPQNDPTKKSPIILVKCRTCLLSMSSIEPSTSLTKKFLPGITLKEAIHYFISDMVSVPWIDEFICAACSKTLRDFAKFIKRCIEIETTCKNIEDVGRKEVDNQLNEHAGSNTDSELNSQVPHKRKWPSQSNPAEDPGKLPNQPNLNFDKLMRTYARKPKTKEEVVRELPEKEESLEPPLFNGTSTDSVEKSTISCQNNPPLLTSVEDYVTEISDEDEPLFNTTKLSQEYSCVISAIQLSDGEKVIVQSFEKKNDCITTGANQETSLNESSAPVEMACRPRCSSTDSGSNNNTNPTDKATEYDSFDESEGRDINKQFNVIEGHSIYSYPVNQHDRIVSISQPNEVLPTFLEDLSMQGIVIYHHGPPKDMKNKRILLLGSVMVPCPICKARFMFMGLRRHMKIRHSTHVQCLPRFEDGISYNCILKPTEIKELPDWEGNTLYIYDYVFKPKPSDNKRIRIHPCLHCNTITYSKKLLTKHISRVHKDLKRYKCEKCGKMFSGKQNYNSHVKRFQNFPSCDFRNCSVCCKMISRENFTSHVKAHHSFICDKCGYSCLSASKFQMHKRVHQYRKYTQRHKQLCPMCGILTIGIASHMKIHGPRSRENMCDKCPKRFISLRNLRAHLRKSHPDKEYKCKECETKCKSIESLRKHVQLKHSKPFLYNCKICGQQFPRGDYFRRHMRNHSEDKSVVKSAPKYIYGSTKSVSVKCKYCSKPFNALSLLKHHILSHIKQIRYKCRICAITYSNLANRHRHEKKHKDPTFDLRCRICWIRMKTKEELEQHMVKHEKSKKYKCHHCGEAFSRKYLLSHHISEEHTTKEEVEMEKQTMFNCSLEEYLR